MTVMAIQLPRVSSEHDVVDSFESFHDAMRDVAAWAVTIVDDDGAASPRDARWLRAFLDGPLAWHIADEETFLAPSLAVRDSGWLDACLAQASARRARITERAADLSMLLEPLGAGRPVPATRFRNAARRFAQAIDDALRYEDDIVLPSARTFLDPAERQTIANDVAACDEGRPWLDVAVAGDAPVIHRVHAVRTRTAHGLDVVRSFAECPRRTTATMATCAGCPHLEGLSGGGDGTGQ